MKKHAVTIAGAGIGAGLGYSLAYFSGTEKLLTTIIFAVTGGVAGYLFEAEQFSSMSGRNSIVRQPPPIGNKLSY